MSTDDNIEGPDAAMRNSDEDVEGHRLATNTDDDVKGHRIAQAAGDDDDVEGHVNLR
ncbi:MAG: hypothetical protein H0T46_15930 [Deltaproteobacteria bacterium]|nr:hypothetical protein [Deltaproteobacteria bacterium]